MAKEAKTPIASEAQAKEETYPVADMVKNAQRLFGYNSDIATAAFAFSHVTECSLSEAKRIVKNFAERKVT